MFIIAVVFVIVKAEAACVDFEDVLGLYTAARERIHFGEDVSALYAIEYSALA